MPKGRLEAFSDGVIAILITIMVLELHTPAGTSWHALAHELPVLFAYALSFVYLGIYWNNHHHMLAVVRRVNGATMWANLHLLFWLSLVPFCTAWMSEHRFPPTPTAVYGIVLLCAALAYYLLQTMLLREEGEESLLRVALGNDVKGRISPLLYCVGIGLSFADRWLALVVYVAVALLWLVPDRRVERHARAALLSDVAGTTAGPARGGTAGAGTPGAGAPGAASGAGAPGPGTPGAGTPGAGTPGGSSGPIA